MSYVPIRRILVESMRCSAVSWLHRALVTGRLEEVERKEDGGSSPLRELQIIGLPGHSSETFTYEQAQTKFDFINTTNLPLHHLEKIFQKRVLYEHQAGPTFWGVHQP